MNTALYINQFKNIILIIYRGRYSDAGSCTVAASGTAELIGVESVRLGNRIPSLEGLGLDGDNAPKRFRRPHDKSWGHLARPGCSWRRCSAKAVRAELSSQLEGALSARSGSGVQRASRRCARGALRSVGGRTSLSIAAMLKAAAQRWRWPTKELLCYVSS